MQTFLPYADFRTSAAVLDDRRLGKQRVETYQILRALTWPTYAWKNHPAVRMWRGFVPALVVYGLACLDEWRARGRADATRAQLLEFTGGAEPTWEALRDAGRLPPWLGSAAVHVSHRSALLRKDPPRYRPYFPGEPDDLPYAWPATPYPRWPLRRGAPEGLPLDEALTLLGVEELLPEQKEALEALADGEPAALGPEHVPSALRTALLAGLTTSGTTLWVTPGAALPDPPPPPDPHPEPGGRVAAVTARPPGPEELAAMVDESTAEAEFAFVRRGAYDPSAVPEGTGLVVLDGLPPDAPAPAGVRVLRLASPLVTAQLAL